MTKPSILYNIILSKKRGFWGTTKSNAGEHNLWCSATSQVPLSAKVKESSLDHASVLSVHYLHDDRRKLGHLVHLFLC